MNVIKFLEKIFKGFLHFKIKVLYSKRSAAFCVVAAYRLYHEQNENEGMLVQMAIFPIQLNL